MSEIDQIKNILQSNNYRVTQSRLAVAKILLKSQDSLLSPDEIFSRIQKSKGLSCDQVSVYRVLSIFEQLGLVRKSIFQGDAARYGLNNLEEEKGHHEHFFKCVKCNMIEAFQDCLVSKKEKELEMRGYKNLNHHLEITGICPNCVNE